MVLVEPPFRRLHRLLPLVAEAVVAEVAVAEVAVAEVLPAVVAMVVVIQVAVEAPVKEKMKSGDHPLRYP